MRLLLLIACLQVFVNQAFADFKLICPGDITVDCNINYSNLDQFGKAYVDNNGTIIWVKDCKVTYDLNDCGYGTITRVWGVEDPDWKWITCTQIITLSNANSFSEKDITWPKDIILESCDPEMDLKNLFRPYDKPIWKTNKCAKPMTNYSDTRFKVSDGCVKIVRIWKILDWCHYDPYLRPNEGIFSSVQVIKLITVDTAARISCPKDTTIEASMDCKGARVQLDLAKVNSPCKMPYVIHNTSAYADTNNADASGFYPVGIHKITYIAEYACGKELKCELILKVLPKIPPVPYCKTGIIIDLMPIDTDHDGTIDNGMIDVWASDLDHGSYHPCGKQKLNFSFSSDPNDRSKRFTCKEIGENEVEIWVTDSNGNQDYCKTKIIIQNNTSIPNCKNFTSTKYELNVSLKHAMDQSPISSTIIESEDMDNHSKIKATELSSGQYQLMDLNNTHQQRLQFNISQNYRPTIKDYQWLSNYLNGKINPNSPYEFLAADINNDAVIDQTDLLLLKKLIFQKRWISNSNYKIVPADALFSLSIAALQEYKKLNMLIPTHSEAKMSKDYYLIPLGRFPAAHNFGNGQQELEHDLISIYSNIEFSVIDKEIFIRNTSEKEVEKQIQIFNSLGELVLTKKISLEKNELKNITSTNWTSGIYYLQVDGMAKKLFLNN